MSKMEAMQGKVEVSPVKLATLLALIPIFYEAAQNDFLVWHGLQPYVFYAALHKIGISHVRVARSF
ncbi:MAG: hypothetical protein KME07_04410 [Pegethrix bostrychoides GSE-TBD4-15B]|jgi:hypothetical protein|uniref:Uncharacterized protein n=1 Tax=Pegethrix bostrychoides GSE-TBD4-15B TaxID=2839662 RepID=A0A951P8I9_9CYAN|nr:hypothetical protein [Pegethrix bostrychoides GSE-TBD4-15B]